MLVEAEPVIATAGHEVEMAAHRPQEILALDEPVLLASGEQARLVKLADRASPVNEFGYPEQRVQVPHATLAVFHVRFDEIPRLTGAAVALVAFGQLLGDELALVARHDLAAIARLQFIEEGLMSADVTGLQHGRHDGGVRTHQPDAVVHRPCRMANLEAHVPEEIEQVFDHAFAPGRLLVGQQEQQVDVRTGGKRAAAIATNRDHGDVFRRRGIAGSVDCSGRKIVERRDQLVLKIGQACSTFSTLARTGQAHFFGLAGLGDQRLQVSEGCRPEAGAVETVFVRKRFQAFDNCGGTVRGIWLQGGWPLGFFAHGNRRC